MSNPKTSDRRVRNYATVVYPESAPSDWFSILERQAVPCFVSPLHDADVNPTGEPKKEHYHVMIMFDGKKTPEQAREVFDLIGGVGCEVVKSVRGYARYLCHLDNPDKTQYETAAVRSIAADYFDIIGLSVDKYTAISEMQDFCEEYNVSSFYVLALYSRRYRPDWHRVLCESSAIYMREYLQSRKWSRDNSQLLLICDPVSGDVVQVDPVSGDVVEPSAGRIGETVTGCDRPSVPPEEDK